MFFSENINLGVLDIQIIKGCLYVLLPCLKFQQITSLNTAQKMKFVIKDFFSKCGFGHIC